MNYTGYVAVKFYTELLLVVALYVFPLPRRKGFPLRLLICLLAGYGYSLVTSPVVLRYYTWALAERTAFHILRYIGTFACIILSVWYCFAVNVRASIFVSAGSYAIQHLVLKIHSFVEQFYMDKLPFPAVAALYLLFLLGSYLLFYILIIRRLHQQDGARIKANETVRLNLLIIISLIVLSVFGFDMRFDTLIQQLSYVGYGVICSVFLLCMQCDIFRKSALEEENEKVELLLAQERKQFENFRAGVEYLNIKCHDLKHQIHILREQPSVSPEAAAELETAIAAYEAYGNTGCPALDMMLGEKYLQCAGSGIEFVSVVSSKKLCRISETDIYSLFGNAIDNAVEYEKTLPEEKRFVRLSVKDVEQMLVIRVENYYEGEPVSSDVMLRTTKRDKQNHGFGMKSMKRICEKYGGEMETKVSGGLFCLTFLFTMP